MGQKLSYPPTIVNIVPLDRRISHHQDLSMQALIKKLKNLFVKKPPSQRIWSRRFPDFHLLPKMSESLRLKNWTVSILLMAAAGFGCSSRVFAEKPDVERIFGRIQFVTAFPDYKVQVTDAFADLHVQVVTSFPDKPGKWQIVESFPDYKIQLVESFPDFTISYVKAFPGKP